MPANQHKRRKAQPGYGVMLVIIFVMVSVLTVVSLQMTGIGGASFYKNSIANVSAINMARTAMSIIRADIYSKLKNGQTVDTTYVYPTTSITVPADPTTMGGSVNVGTYSGFVKYVSGNSYLVQVTANVGGVSYTYSEPFNVKGGVIYPLDGLSYGPTGTPNLVAAYSTRRLRQAYTGKAFQLFNGDTNYCDIGFDATGNLSATDVSNCLSANWVNVNPPLDNLSTGTPIGAYGLRKMRSAYSGNAVSVRRSSDNSCQSIGFDANGNLDVAALESFVGSGDGYVRIWYDQSTAGNDLSQGTCSASTKQPMIAKAGKVIRQNGRPTVWFDGSGMNVQKTLSTAISTRNITASAMGSPVEGYQDNSTLVGVQNNADYGAENSVGSNLLIGAAETYYSEVAGNWLIAPMKGRPISSAALTDTYSLNQFYVFRWSPTTTSGNCTANKTCGSFYLNSTYQGEQTVSPSYHDITMNLSIKKIVIGSNAAGDYWYGWKGYISEVILYRNLGDVYDGNGGYSNSSQIYPLINSQMMYYNPTKNGQLYVSKWYDQSGNGYDLVPADASYPFSFLPDTTMAKPGVVFNAYNWIGMKTANTLSITGNPAQLTAFGVVLPTYENAYLPGIGIQNDKWTRILAGTKNTEPNDYDNQYSAVILEAMGLISEPGVVRTAAERGNPTSPWEYKNGPTLAPGRFNQLTTVFNGTNVVLRANGTAGGPAPYEGSFNIQQLWIGNSKQSNAEEGVFDGVMNEIVLYKTTLSASDISNFEANQKNYFGTQ